MLIRMGLSHDGFQCYSIILFWNKNAPFSGENIGPNLNQCFLNILFPHCIGIMLTFKDCESAISIALYSGMSDYVGFSV